MASTIDQNNRCKCRLSALFRLFAMCGWILAGFGFCLGPVFAQSERNLTVNGSLQFDRTHLVKMQEKMDSSVPKAPSKVKALFLSLALPGCGEYYAGSKRVGTIFLASEVTLWAGYLSLRTYGNWKKQDYQLFAAAHAGVDPSGKDHQFFVDVENFASIVDYNNAKLRQRNLNELYPEDKTHYWIWDKDSSRKQYEKMRLSSDKAYNVSLFMIAGIVLNHVVSGIDAVRAARQKEKLNIKVGMSNLNGKGFAISIIKTF